MVRSILGVIAGFLAMAVLTTVATTIAVKAMLQRGNGSSPIITGPYLAVNLTYSAVFAALGGYLSAVIAARNPVHHALALSGVLLITSTISFLQNQPGQPRWYAATLIGLCPLSALLGGYLRAIQLPH